MSQFYIQVPGGPPAIPLQFTTDSGIATPAASNVNVFGGTGTQTSGAGDTITIQVKTDGFGWSEQTMDFNAVSQNGYFCNAGLTATLPAGTSLGNSIIIYVDTPSTVVVLPGAGQNIEVGGAITATSATTSVQGSMLGLVFKPSDSTWHAIESMGSWTLA